MEDGTHRYSAGLDESRGRQTMSRWIVGSSRVRRISRPPARVVVRKTGTVGIFLFACFLTFAATPAVFGLWSEELVVSGSVQTAVDFPPVLAYVTITPQTLDAGSEGPPLEAQIAMPGGGCNLKETIFGSVTLGVAGRSSVIHASGEVARNQNLLVVRFNRQSVIGLLGAAGGEVMLEVRGEDAHSCEFVGADTIRYIMAPVESNNMSVGGDVIDGASGDVLAPDSTGAEPVGAPDSSAGDPVGQSETPGDSPTGVDDDPGPADTGDTGSEPTDGGTADDVASDASSDASTIAEDPASGSSNGSGAESSDAP